VVAEKIGILTPKETSCGEADLGAIFLGDG
jgi:hypothetical protein